MSPRDLLADAVRAPTFRVSVDSFLQPPHLRYQRGELSPEGYYLDSFDDDALLERCLLPPTRSLRRRRTW